MGFTPVDILNLLALFISIAGSFLCSISHRKLPLLNIFIERKKWNESENTMPEKTRWCGAACS
jgi:hypothetical protein